MTYAVHFITVFFCSTNCPQTKRKLLRCTSSQVHVLHLPSEQCWACKRLKELRGGDVALFFFLLIISGDNTGLGFWMMEISELLSSYCLSKRLCDKMLRHPFSIFFHSVRCLKQIKDWKVLRFHLFIHSCPPAVQTSYVYQWEKAMKAMILKCCRLCTSTSEES